MKRFDYDFIKKNISSDLVNKVTHIYELKGRLDSYVKKKMSTSDYSLNMNVINDAYYNNDINEVDCTINEIIDLVNADYSDNELENNTIGFMKALKYIFSKYRSISFNKENLLNIYSLLINDRNDRVSFRNEDITVNDYDEFGNEIIIFNPSSYRTIDTELDTLFMNYNIVSKLSLNPVIYIPLILLDLYTIYPFIKRNDEMIRLITILLLLKNGFDIVLIGSYNEFISKNLNEYRIMFNDVVKTNIEDIDYEAFLNNEIKFFSDFMSLKVYEMELKKEKKSERIERMLLESNLPISKSDISSVIKDASLNMIELILSRLIKEGKIKKVGSFKDAKYIRNE